MQTIRKRKEQEKISISKWRSCHSRFFLLYRSFFLGSKSRIRKCCGLIFVYFTISLHKNTWWRSFEDARCQNFYLIYLSTARADEFYLTCRTFVLCNRSRNVKIFREEIFDWISCGRENICESCKNVSGLMTAFDLFTFTQEYILCLFNQRRLRT